MRVLAVTADASLQVALASMMPDWELRALSDASDAVDAGDAAVALVDLGSTARGLEAARALTMGLQIPCVVIGDEDVADDFARIVVRPFTLSELGDAVSSAAAEGLRFDPFAGASTDEAAEAVEQVAGPVEERDQVAEEEGLPELEPAAEVVDLPEAAAEAGEVSVLDAPVETSDDDPNPVAETVEDEPSRQIAAEAEEALEQEEEAFVLDEVQPFVGEAPELPADEDDLAPVVPIADARAPKAEEDEAPAQTFKEAFEALADIAAIPLDEPAPEPEDEHEPEPEDEHEPAPEDEADTTDTHVVLEEPETVSLNQLLDELGQKDGEPPFDGGAGPIAPVPLEPTSPSKTVEYVRALLAEIDAEPEPALAGARAGARVVRERAPRPVVRQNIVPEPTIPGRRGLRRRKAAAAVKQQAVQPVQQQGIMGRLSVALWAARDLEALLNEMPALAEPRTVAHAFLGQTVELFGPDTAAVYVAKPDGSWRVLAPHGLSQVEAGMNVASDQPLFREVANGGNGVFIAPVDLAQGLVAGIGGARTETLMAAPLEAGGQCVAVAIVGGAALAETDLSSLCEMASEAAPGLAFALLMERMRARL